MNHADTENTKKH